MIDNSVYVVEDNDEADERDKRNDKMVKTLVDRVVEISKEHNHDLVIELLQADKAKLVGDIQRIKDKNRGLKA